MGSPTLDANRETARIQAIEACDLLDSRREACFDRLVFVAAQLFGVPMAVVAVVQRDHISVKAGVGPLLREWPRDMTFCDTVVRLDQMLVVEDAAIHYRFSRLPMVTGAPQVRFYAGAPIHGRDGYAVATLCILGTHVRIFSEQARFQLKQLALEADSFLQEATSLAV